MISAGRMGGRAACCLITLSLQVFSMLRCPRCLGTGKTEDRDHTHLVHLARCDGGHAGKHQTKAPRVTDGVAEWEGNQLCLKVFHLFFISVRRLQAHFWWQHPPGLFYGYVRRPDSVCQNFSISWWNCKCVYWLCSSQGWNNACGYFSSTATEKLWRLHTTHKGNSLMSFYQDVLKCGRI